MKKTGYVTAAVGALLTLALFLVRLSDWYAEEMRKPMSEFGELITAGFWASVVLTLFGGFLLLRSLRRRDDAPAEQPMAAPVPLTATWVCPSCGTVNGDGLAYCAACGMPKPEWTRT